MTTSVQVLQSIYGVLQKIETNTRNTTNKENSNTNKITGGLGITDLLNTKSVDNLEKASKSIPIITKNITELTKLEENKKLDKTVKSLNNITDAISRLGSIPTNVFNNIEGVNKLINNVGSSLLKFSLSVVGVAGALTVAGMLFGVKGPLLGLTMLGTSVLGVGLILSGIGLLEKPIQKGINVINGIGLGFIAFSVSIVSYLFTMSYMSKYLNTDNLSETVSTVAWSLLPFGLTMGLIGALSPNINSGNTSILQIGASMVLFSASIWLSAKGLDEMKKLTQSKTLQEASDVYTSLLRGFTYSFVVLGVVSPLLFTGANAIAIITTSFLTFTFGLGIASGVLIYAAKELGYKTIATAIGGVAAGVMSLVGAYVLIGKLSAPTYKGAFTLLAVSASMLVFSGVFAVVGSTVGNMMNKSETIKSSEYPILNTIGLLGGGMAVLVGGMVVSALAMSAISALAVPTLLGAGVSLVVSGALLANISAIKYINNNLEGINTANLFNNITNLIGGTFNSMLNGFKIGLGINDWSSVSELFGGDFSFKKIGNLIKGPLKSMGNISLLLGGSLLLMEMSVALSMFGVALSIFNKPGIIGELKYDEKGNPLPTNNSTNVVQNAN
ncbi:MAG: hypothetical protein RSE41_03900, partial [Clostridia bacterium]